MQSQDRALHYSASRGKNASRDGQRSMFLFRWNHLAWCC